MNLGYILCYILYVMCAPLRKSDPVASFNTGTHTILILRKIFPCTWWASVWHSFLFIMSLPCLYFSSLQLSLVTVWLLTLKGNECSFVSIHHISPCFEFVRSSWPQVITDAVYSWPPLYLTVCLHLCICLSVIYIRYQFLDEAFQNQKGIIETFMAKLQEKRNFVHFSATQVQSRYEIILGVCYCREVVTENGVCGIMLPMLQFCFPVTLARNWEY